MSPGKMLSRKDLAPRGWSKRMMTTFLPEPEGPLEVGDGLFPRPVWALSTIEELERGPRGSPLGAHLGATKGSAPKGARGVREEPPQPTDLRDNRRSRPSLGRFLGR